MSKEDVDMLDNLIREVELSELLIEQKDLQIKYLEKALEVKELEKTELQRLVWQLTNPKSGGNYDS